jgi:heavy metal efflux system protein
MLERLIKTALHQRLLAFLGMLALVAWGLNAYSKLPIDAFPDVAPVQVLVSMRAPGLTPEELESRVTAPIAEPRQNAFHHPLFSRPHDVRVLRGN